MADEKSVVQAPPEEKEEVKDDATQASLQVRYSCRSTVAYGIWAGRGEEGAGEGEDGRDEAAIHTREASREEGVGARDVQGTVELVTFIYRTPVRPPRPLNRRRRLPARCHSMRSMHLP